MTAAEYETVVRDIAEALVSKATPPGPPEVYCGKAKLWPGASGYAHQIDVSLEGADYIVWIECKKWSSRVEVPAMLTFAARLVDLRAENTGKQCYGFMVTTCGFESGVKTIAVYFDVELYRVQSATDFAMQFRDRALVGASDSGVGMDEVSRVEVRCAACRAEMVLRDDGQTYVCPQCPSKP
jgi:hypothetical protein